MSETQRAERCLAGCLLSEKAVQCNGEAGHKGQHFHIREGLRLSWHDGPDESAVLGTCEQAGGNIPHEHIDGGAGACVDWKPATLNSTESADPNAPRQAMAQCVCGYQSSGPEDFEKHIAQCARKRESAPQRRKR